MEKFQIYFFTFSFLAVILLAATIFMPFLVPVSIAATLAIIFSPLHERLARSMGGSRGIAAFFTVTVAALIIIPPFFFIVGSIFREAVNFSSQLNGAGMDNISNSLYSIQQKLNVYFPDLRLDVGKYLPDTVGWLSANIGTIFTGVAKVTIDLVLNLFIGIIAFYYFLKDGKSLIKAVVELSPLPDRNDYEILEKLEKAINSVVKGSLVIALIRGILGWIGFTVFGVPNPALLGSALAIAALIPGVGPLLIMAPSIIYLFLMGMTSAAVGLLIWEAVIIVFVDNMLGPALMKRGIKVHPLFILLSVIGGIGFFGPIGFLLGPIVLSLLFAMIEIYRLLVRSEKKAF